MEGSNRAFVGHTSDGCFGNDHCVAEGQCQNDIDEQEYAARYGKRQMFPSPTEAPAADRTNPSFPEKELLL